MFLLSKARNLITNIYSDIIDNSDTIGKWICYVKKKQIKFKLTFVFILFFSLSHQGCQMPDTLNSWFLVAQLHVW